MLRLDLEESVDVFDPQRVVSLAVKGRGLQPAKVGGPRQHDRDQPVHEVVHLAAVERHLGALEEPLARLVARVASLDTRKLGLLAGDELKEEGGSNGVVEPFAKLRTRRSADRDLRHLWDLVHILVRHLGQQVLPHDGVVE